MKRALLSIAAVAFVVGLVACENFLNDSGGSNNGGSTNPTAVSGRVLVSATEGAAETAVVGATVEAWSGTTLLEGDVTDGEGRFSFDSEYDDDVVVVVSIENYAPAESVFEAKPLYAGAAREVSEQGSSGLSFSFVGPFTDASVDGTDISVAWNVVENGDDPPLAVANVFQLQAITVPALTSNVHLVRDVDASATGSWNGDQGFTPLSSFQDRTFDGLGFTISDLTIQARPEATAGVFEEIRSATIRNLIITNLVLEDAAGEAGGLAARSENATVHNVSVSGNVSSTANLLGGLLGTVTVDSTITHSHFSGSVTASGSLQDIGGLIGVIDSGALVEDSSSQANVTAGDSIRVGGLVGHQKNSSEGTVRTVSEIRESSASGSVVGDQEVGGLVGRSSFFAIIASTSASGDVTATQVDGGGALIGVRGGEEVATVFGTATGVLTVNSAVIPESDPNYLVGAWDSDDD